MIDRSEKYSKTCEAFSRLSDDQLSSLITKAQPLQSGIGGKSVLITIEDTPIFVKKVPLTDLELQPQNVKNTANLFGLPLCCQYGIGSPGFGAWRELLAHTMTTDWVLGGQCLNFPLLYHWRALPSPKQEPMNMDEWGSLDAFVKFWDGAVSVRERINAINGATSQIYLFLEYVPQNLYDWLSARLSAGKAEAEAESALQFALEKLEATNQFMIEAGLLHFDAHFKNILTDGELIYFTDFGLALSSQFDLSCQEIDFFEVHKNYDCCSTAISLVHCIIASQFGGKDWSTVLQEYVNGGRGELSSAMAAVVRQNAAIALAMNDFYQKLKHNSKSTPYPDAELEKLLTSANYRFISHRLCP